MKSFVKYLISEEFLLSLYAATIMIVLPAIGFATTKRIENEISVFIIRGISIVLYLCIVLFTFYINYKEYKE